MHTLLLMWLFPLFAHATLPSGIPATTTNDANCFLPNEVQEHLDQLPRMTVEGCPQKIVQATNIVNGHAVYLSDNHTYDCEGVRADKFGRLQTTQALGELDHAANEFFEDPNNNDKALCITNTVYEWAKADGYSKIEADSVAQARNAIAWAMSGFASIYLKATLSRSLAKSSGKDVQIVKWFNARGEDLFADVNSHSNNLRNWRGYALTAVGIVAQNAKFVIAGKTVFDYAIGQITYPTNPADQGWLPQELARMERAEAYHAFALSPILAMVAASKSINCNFLQSGDQENRLAALIGKLVQGSQDPSVFKKKTGIAQTETAYVEGRFPMLGDDDQALKVLKQVAAYLSTYKMVMVPRSSDSSANFGGREDRFPAPASIPITSANLKSFCNNK